MATALTETLNRPLDPLSIRNQVSKPESRQSLLTDFRDQKSESERRIMEEERDVTQRGLEKEEQVQQEYTGAIERRTQELEQQMAQMPQRKISEFKPEDALELAGMTALISAFAGSVSGNAALAAMEGFTTGYRQGREDLYNRELKTYENELDAYKQKMQNAKILYENYLRLENEKKGSGLIQVKKIQQLLPDTLISEKIRANRIGEIGTDIQKAIDLSDRITEKLMTATPAAPSLTEVVDPENPSQILRVDARIYKPGTSIGSPGVLGVSGKEPKAGAAEAKKEEGSRKFESILQSLSDTYKTLAERGAITDTQQSVLKNFSASIATLPPSQYAQRMFGGDSQRLRDFIESQRPLLIQSIVQATGMSSRALDSNRELEFYLQAVTDVSKSYQANVDAIQSLRRVFGKLEGRQPDSEDIQNDAIRDWGAYEPQTYLYRRNASGRIERTKF
jgi:hypothetical protein